MNYFRFIVAAVLCSAAGASAALDFRNVGSAAIILYDAPSARADKLFIAPRGMPLEVVLSYGEWVKVRDVTGELAWTEVKGLNHKASVIVRTANLKVRSSADETATPAFIADKGILLEVLEASPSGWIKVRHRDGTSGFVKSADIWGQ